MAIGTSSAPPRPRANWQFAVRGGAWFATTSSATRRGWCCSLLHVPAAVQVHVFGVIVPFSRLDESALGLSLPVMANVSEIVHGAIQSIPTGQWESAYSLAFTRRRRP